MSKDTFYTRIEDLQSPARDAFEILPDDNNDLEVLPRELYIGVIGDLKVDFADSGTGIIIKAAEGRLPYRIKKVYATGTTAESIIGVY